MDILTRNKLSFNNIFIEELSYCNRSRGLYDRLGDINANELYILRKSLVSYFNEKGYVVLGILGCTLAPAFQSLGFALGIYMTWPVYCTSWITLLILFMRFVLRHTLKRGGNTHVALLKADLQQSAVLQSANGVLVACLLMLKLQWLASFDTIITRVCIIAITEIFCWCCVLINGAISNNPEDWCNGDKY